MHFVTLFLGVHARTPSTLQPTFALGVVRVECGRRGAVFAWSRVAGRPEGPVSSAHRGRDVKKQIQKTN